MADANSDDTQAVTASSTNESRASARVYTIPHGAPFLPTLANAIMRGELPGPDTQPPEPLALPDYTLLLPTRRAERALADAFLAASGAQAMLLPTIRTIADRDEDEALLAQLENVSASELNFSTSLPPAIDKIDRILALTKLVISWSEAMRSSSTDPSGEVGIGTIASAGARTPAQAAHLAAELGSLMDMVETENVSLEGLGELVPDSFADHWQKTLQFLDIVITAWPHYLSEQGLVNPAWRRNKLILSEAQRISQSQPKGPVIVAGVTGSIPAAAELMRTVAGLEGGAIVLPGLDLDMDEASWQAITPLAESQTGSEASISGAQSTGHPDHPQFGLKRLLDRIGIERGEVKSLGAPRAPARTQHAQTARSQFIAEAMRPTSTTQNWHGWVAEADRSQIAGALDGVSRIEAPSAQDEAEIGALILREAAETPGRTAALVSPDRLLARRVATRLETWGIRVDDSAGRPFIKTTPGAFLDLVIECATKRFAPAELMALLKHPLCRLELPAFDIRRAGRALELAAFRTPYLGDGLNGVEAALERAAQSLDYNTVQHPHRAVARLWDDDWDGARELIQRLKSAFAPLADMFKAKSPQSLRALANAHITTAEELSRLPEGPTENQEQTPDNPLYAGEAGATASALFQKFLEDSPAAPDMNAADYADFYRGLVASENVRQRLPVHPRLFIWGPFEARLQHPDVVILGGLNDGKWPEAADPGAWLNRPMRQALGLPSPEEKIGYAAHDVTSLLGCEIVYLTRAEKIDGDPTVPSRWLMRIEALLDGLDLKDALVPDTPWRAWAVSRNQPDAHTPVLPPSPCPPIVARPRKLSVSAIETWIKNPYAIYASRILNLDPLPPLGEPPGPSLRGSIIHDAMARFAKAHDKTLPSDVFASLMGLAGDVLKEYTAHPRIAAFWLPRFERFARWFAETEHVRRSGLVLTLAEVSGSLVLEGPAGPFVLTARADRIDLTSGGVIITDYKTGQVPSGTNVLSGAAPQLPLEAAIALAGSKDDAGFPGIPQGTSVQGLRYIRASGAEPPGEEKDVKADDPAAVAADALAGLQRLIARFDDPATPYAAVRRAKFTYDYDAYTHLARVAEWSAGDTAESEA